MKLRILSLLFFSSLIISCTAAPSASSGSESGGSGENTFQPVVAINADFDSSYGPGIYVSRGNGVSQNFLTTNVNGQTCLMH